MSFTVTVGLDGSRESIAAADWAAREAFVRDVPLRLVQVHETGAYPYSPLVDDQVERRWARQLTDDEMRTLIGRYPKLRITRQLLSGHPAHVLADLSADSGLLVLGSRGLGSVLGFLVGGVALPAVAHTHCPAVLVRAENRPGGERDAEGHGQGQGQGDRDGALTEAGAPAVPATEAPSAAKGGPVLLGVDLNHPCDDILAFAFETADRNSVPLHALYGWSLPPAYGIAPRPHRSSDTSDHGGEKDRELTQVLRPWQRKFPEVTVDARALIGRPARLLVEAAPEASLVVVGRRVRRSRTGTHIGPTTHAVMHHARTPVAVVPHD